MRGSILLHPQVLLVLCEFKGDASVPERFRRSLRITIAHTCLEIGKHCRNTMECDQGQGAHESARALRAVLLQHSDATWCWMAWSKDILVSRRYLHKEHDFSSLHIQIRAQELAETPQIDS